MSITPESMPPDLIADGPSELAMSIAWHGGMTRQVTTIDGDLVDIVFPGHWSHGQGPDFRHAKLAFPDSRLVSGDVELHLHARDWERHGHHVDPAYDNVILHVAMSVENGAVTRRSNGGLVPIARIGIAPERLESAYDLGADVWSQLGGHVCAPDLAASTPHVLRDVLQRLGDVRFEERVTALEGDLAVVTPLDALLRGLFDAFGYARNREPMRALAERLPWRSVLLSMDRGQRSDAWLHLLALQFGTGGWLPLAPPHARLARLGPRQVDAVETAWRTSAYRDAAALPTCWDMSRVRPANHPVARIATLAALLADAGSYLITLLTGAIRNQHSVPALLRAVPETFDAPALGDDRAIAIAASVVLPFTVALARSTDDADLEDAAHFAWSTLRSAPLSQPARRARIQAAGEAPIRGLMERGNQGLLVLDKRYCEPRRCFECPVAHAVVRSSASVSQDSQ